MYRFHFPSIKTVLKDAAKLASIDREIDAVHEKLRELEAKRPRAGSARALSLQVELDRLDAENKRLRREAMAVESWTDPEVFVAEARLLLDGEAIATKMHPSVPPGYPESAVRLEVVRYVCRRLHAAMRLFRDRIQSAEDVVSAVTDAADALQLVVNQRVTGGSISSDRIDNFLSAEETIGLAEMCQHVTSWLTVLSHDTARLPTAEEMPAFLAAREEQRLRAEQVLSGK